MPQYKILTGNIPNLENDVRNHLNDSWFLAGGVTCVGNGLYAQAVYR
jgi:hypothetical protein